jgi:protein-disulfide isomerase
MSRRKRVPPRAAREAQIAKQASGGSKKTLRVTLLMAASVAVVAGIAALTVGDRTGGHATAGDPTGLSTANRDRIDSAVNALFAGIPQEGSYLGRRTAPVTMEVFIDLEDPTCRWWFRENLPAIVRDDVRTGALRLRYHAFKRNTYWPAVFVKQQAAALAAGAQGKLWDFIDTFFYEQGKELTHYVTENFLQGVAGQVPGLNLARWQADRRTGRREEQTAAEDQAAKAVGLYVTPAFRIGKTGGPMSIFTGRRMVQYPEQHHPIALIETTDVGNAIKVLNHNRSLPLARRVSPQILTTRLE